MILKLSSPGSDLNLSLTLFTQIFCFHSNKERRSDELYGWLTEVVASEILALKSFANGLQADLAAVRYGLQTNWSNGATEGHINRLKFIKRQMYSRTKLDLLRKRVLYYPPYH